MSDCDEHGETDHATGKHMTPSELSAVCFRACQTPTANLDAFNRAVLAGVNQRGRVYISNATINGSFALRACITNHRTTEEDLDMTIDEVENVAASLA